MDKEYEEFLKSPEWTYKSLKFREKHPACMLCGRKENLQVHHVAYTDNLLNEKYLSVLCRDCHSTLHGTINKIKELHDEKHILWAWDVQPILADATVEFYKKSFTKKGNKPNLFCHNDFVEFKDFLSLNLYNLIFYKVYTSEEQSIEWDDLSYEIKAREQMLKIRTELTKKALAAGCNRKVIQDVLKMKDNTWYKTIKEIKENN